MIDRCKTEEWEAVRRYVTTKLDSFLSKDRNKNEHEGYQAGEQYTNATAGRDTEC